MNRTKFLQPLVTLGLTLAIIQAFAQDPIQKRQVSWQQYVAYDIQVTLDDVAHSLSGYAQYTYTNNSPDTLDKLYFHIWPNAYRDNSTDFAKQQLLNGSTKFYYAPDSMRGYIDSLSFSVNGQQVEWATLPDQIDISVLQPKQPILPGQTIKISTPFFVKIPGSFSRFGHEGQGYQMTQWYPKPAVYDVNGWNPMAYLDQGEFYSEFGDFTVRITIPDNYVVAATGELQEASEKAFWQNRIENPITHSDPIATSSRTKTITFKQGNIHDFAWFADKRFNIEKNETTLESGKKIETYVFADETDLNHTQYIDKALKYYSSHCGDYPYSHCTAVKGALKAGGGMEYPMITVVNWLGEDVIVHEVGHNWFYGIFGTDERRYPWMDESINSYFENQAVHGQKASKPSLEKDAMKQYKPAGGITSLALQQFEIFEQHQAVGGPSKLFTSNNYGLMVYMKGQVLFDFLKAYLGQELLDKCFQTYFRKWSYKHPLPKDMQDVFEEVTGQDLTWFFDGLIDGENHIDVGVKSIDSRNLTLRNYGVKVPIEVGVFNEGVFVESFWVHPFVGDTTVRLPARNYDVVKLDPYERLPEINRKNNTIRTSGIAKRVEPLHLGLVFKPENPNQTSLRVMPIVGYNIHDKTMVGLWLTRPRFPMRTWNYSVMSLYSAHTEQVNGFASLTKDIYRNKPMNNIKFGIDGQRFTEVTDKARTYTKLRPYIQFNFRDKDKRIPKRSKLTLSVYNIDFTPQYDLNAAKEALTQDTGFALGRRSLHEPTTRWFGQVEFKSYNSSKLNPTKLRVRLQYGMPSMALYQYDTTQGMVVQQNDEDPFTKLDVEWRKKISYNVPKKGLNILVFGGVFLDKSENGIYQYRLASQAGAWDYTYDQILMGRSATSGVFRNQVTRTDAFLKEPGNFGNMDQWLIATNLQADAPFKLPIAGYLDVATFPDIKDLTGESFVFNAGLSVRLIPDYFEIYFPLARSSYLKGVQEVNGEDNYGQRITFQLNLNIFDDLDFSSLMRNTR